MGWRDGKVEHFKHTNEYVALNLLWKVFWKLTLLWGLNSVSRVKQSTYVKDSFDRVFYNEVF
jgi:hypothetical protein